MTNVRAAESVGFVFLFPMLFLSGALRIISAGADSTIERTMHEDFVKVFYLQRYIMFEQ
jgi:hypothetical protein